MNIQRTLKLMRTVDHFFWEEDSALHFRMDIEFFRSEVLPRINKLGNYQSARYDITIYSSMYPAVYRTGPEENYSTNYTVALHGSEFPYNSIAKFGHLAEVADGSGTPCYRLSFKGSQQLLKDIAVRTNWTIHQLLSSPRSANT